MKLKIVVLSISAIILSGCNTLDPYSGEVKTSNSVIYGVGGAVLCGVGGAMVSGKKDQLKGAIIGSTACGALGSIYGNSLDEQESLLRRELLNSGVQVSRVGKEIKLILDSNITFSPAQTEIKSEYYSILNSISKVLKKYKNTRVDIKGYTDNSGLRMDNLYLSEERAENVRKFLIQSGIKSGRIYARGYGDMNPIYTNTTFQGRAKNRRVEIHLSEL